MWVYTAVDAIDEEKVNLGEKRAKMSVSHRNAGAGAGAGGR